MATFDYKNFHDFYTSVDNQSIYDIADDASAIVYTWKAYNGLNEKPKATPGSALGAMCGNAVAAAGALPKISRTIRQFRYKQIDKLARLKLLSDKYSDIFFILNERNSKRLEDQVFFVFPRHKFDQVTGMRSKHMFADHFSFQFNACDPHTPVHLHETMYVPYNEEETYGDITRLFCNFTPAFK